MLLRVNWNHLAEIIPQPVKSRTPDHGDFFKFGETIKKDFDINVDS